LPEKSNRKDLQKHIRVEASINDFTSFLHKPYQERSRFKKISETSVGISIKDLCLQSWKLPSVMANVRRKILAEIIHHHTTRRSQIQIRKAGEHKS